MAYRTRPHEFYQVTQALCTQCLSRVQAKIVFEDDRVFLDKRCPEHGAERVLIADEVDWFRRTREGFLAPGGLPNEFQTEAERGCPFDCGLCPAHEQHTCVALLEVTETCNLKCPVCFAGSSPEPGAAGHRSLEQIDRMIASIERSEDQLNVLQLSGGEPTLHPDFFEIVAKARRARIRHIMVNTNGIRIAEDRDFAERLRDLRPDFEIYLQFDSLREGATHALRGANLLGVKQRALDTLNELDISTTLVMTVQKGVNDDELGDIISHGLEQPCVRGVTFQLMQEAGRFPTPAALTERLTLSEVRRKLCAQSDVLRDADIMPLPCHSDSMAMGYAFKIGDAVIPLSDLLEPEALLQAGGSGLSPHSDPELGRQLFEAFSAGHSPSSHADSLRELLTCFPDPAALGELTYRNVFRVLLIHFMDAASLEIRGLMRSCIHIVHPDGRLIPFDTYNLLHR